MKLYEIQILASIIKFLWNTALFFCFDYICATVAKLSSYNSYWPAMPEVFTLLQKQSANPGLKCGKDSNKVEKKRKTFILRGLA